MAQIMTLFKFCFQIFKDGATREEGPLHLQSSSNRILIKGGTVVNEDGSVKADVYVEDRFGLERIITFSIE